MTREPEDDFKEMELWEHLDELRTRLIRSAVYVLLGLVLAWAVYPWLYELFFGPLRPYLKQHPEWGIRYTTFTQPFMLKLQVSLIAGLVLAIPLVTLEAWGFIAPGLTRNERRACRLIFPAAILCFIAGIACGYLLMPVTIGYFLGFVTTGDVVLQDPVLYLVFTIKMVLAFGICFELPVILMGLTWIGLVTQRQLREQWRYAVVGCFAVAAIATPGGDPMTMCIMASPLALLYVASIYLCGIVERWKERYEVRHSLELERLGETTP